MLSYLENKSDNSKKENSEKDLKKFREAIFKMQNQIISEKSERYNYEFSKDLELTATEKVNGNLDHVTERTENEENKEIKGKGMEKFAGFSGTSGNSEKAVNKYKQKLQALLGKKSLREISVK
jgi:hypothetical protein